MAYHMVDNNDGYESNRVSEQPLWKSYLYQLQQQAPKPKRIVSERSIPNRPEFYGREYHGPISREQATQLLRADGDYLIRESQRQPGSYTLGLRFHGDNKNYKLYFDHSSRTHYVGEKRFETMQELVQDGLITMYMELEASDYISVMAQEPVYDRVTQFQKHKHPARVGNSEVSARPGNAEVYAPVQQLQVSIAEADTAGDTAVSTATAAPQCYDYEKPHGFKMNSFKGLHWCQWCGNFMWGLVQQGMRCADCGLIIHKQCAVSVPRDCVPDMKFVKRVFGVDLTTLVKAYKTSIPFVVEVCVRELESRGLHCEGLYRECGFNEDIESIRSAFESDGAGARLEEFDDVNAVAGALKLYFRDLPIPLISFEAYPHFIAAANRESFPQRVESLRAALQALPPAHFQTLRYFLAHLVRVSRLSDSNLMGPENLGVVFGPTLLRCPESQSWAMLSELPTQRLVVELLVTGYTTLFPS